MLVSSPRKTHLGFLSAASFFFLDGGLRLLVLVTTTPILSRLLPPADFGLFALALAPYALLGSAPVFGVDSLILAGGPLSSSSQEALAALNRCWLRSLILFLLIAGGLLAWFRQEPALLALTLAVAILGYANGSQTIMISLYKKQLLAKPLTMSSALALAIGATLSVTLAIVFPHWGAFTLLPLFAGQQLGPALLAFFRPLDCPTSMEPLSSIFLTEAKAHCRSVTQTRFCQCATRGLEPIVLSLFAPTGMIGIYQKANQWAALPAQQTFQPLHSLTLQALGTAFDEKSNYQETFRALQLLFLTLSVGPSLFVAVEASRIVLLLFGAQWLEAIPILQILAVATAVGALSQLTKTVYLAEGRAKDRWRWVRFSGPACLVGFAGGALSGSLVEGVSPLLGAALGYGVLLVLTSLGAWFYCLQKSSLRRHDVTHGVSRVLIAVTLATVLHFYLGAYQHSLPPLLQLTMAVALFSFVYLLTLLALPGSLYTLGTLRTLSDKQAATA